PVLQERATDSKFAGEFAFARNRVEDLPFVAAAAVISPEHPGKLAAGNHARTLGDARVIDAPDLQNARGGFFRLRGRGCRLCAESKKAQANKSEQEGSRFACVHFGDFPVYDVKCKL